MNAVYLSVEQVIAIHERSLEAYGGQQGIRDRGLLEAAVHRPMYSIGLVDAYPDAFSKAAALLHSLALNHCFIDGNKRTAFLASVLFLQINGYLFSANQEQSIELVYRIASGAEKDIQKTANRLMLYCSKSAALQAPVVYNAKVNFDVPNDPTKGSLEFSLKAGYLSKDQEIFFHVDSEQPGHPGFRFFKPNQHEDHLEVVYQTADQEIVQRDFRLGDVPKDKDNQVQIKFQGKDVEVVIAGQKLAPIVLAEE